MSKNFVRFFGVSLLAISMSVFAGPPVVNPDAMDLDSDMHAKITKEKSKEKSKEVARQRTDSTSDNNGCGSVDIGNSSKNSTGVGAAFEKSKTVIVTGPVINMANCK